MLQYKVTKSTLENEGQKNDGFSADKNKKGDNRLSPFCVDKTLIEEGNPCFPYHAAKLQEILIGKYILMFLIGLFKYLKLFIIDI